MVAGTFTNRYSYNGLGQLLTEDGPWADDTVTYTYNSAALRTVLSLAQPSASAWTNGYSYDAAKRLTNLISAAGSFGYSYDSTRKLEVSGLNLGSGLSISKTYDSVARLLNSKLERSGPVTLNGHTYTNNTAGQRIGEARNWGLNGIAFSYDSAGQLISALATDNAGSVARGHEQFRYFYDPAGNLTTRSNNALGQTFTVNSRNQATNVSRSGTFTVAGGVSDYLSVTINGSSVDRVHDDLTFSKAGLTLTNGANRTNCRELFKVSERNFSTQGLRVPPVSRPTSRCNSRECGNDPIVPRGTVGSRNLEEGILSGVPRRRLVGRR